MKPNSGNYPYLKFVLVIRQYFKLSNLSEITLMVVSLLALIGILIALGSWVIYRPVTIPSDILMMILVSQLIDNLGLLIGAAYSIYHDDVHLPADFSSACTGIGVLRITGNLGMLYYNILFCLIMAHSVRTTLKGSLFSQARYHTLCFFIIAAVLTALLITNNVGTQQNGLCGYKFSADISLMKAIFEFFLVVLCLNAMKKFRAYLPESQSFKRQKIFVYYSLYMGTFALIQFASSGLAFVGSLMCRFANNDIAINEPVIVISCLMEISMSFATITVRLTHPQFKNRLARYLSPKSYFPESQSFWLGCLLESLKGSQIMSFLVGINISHTEHINQPINTSYEVEFCRTYNFMLNQDISNAFSSYHYGQRDSMLVQEETKGLAILPYKVSAYFPEAMAVLQQAEHATNLRKSFKLNQNVGYLRAASGINGGKSGQLFFLSYDSQFIFKTIRQEEAKIYLSKAKSLSQYWSANPDSMIVRILGLYRFERTDIKERPIYIILMKNLTLHPKTSNYRIYDLKGSQFNRSTLKDKKLKSTDERLKDYTLKDTDFKRLEGCLPLKPADSIRVKDILLRDITFLSTLEVMDYSLLYVRRIGPLQKENSKNQFEMGASQINSDPMDDSTVRSSVDTSTHVINLGIIDYLEPWNLRRKTQRLLKTIVAKGEVTPLNPESYSERMKAMLIEIMI